MKAAVYIRVSTDKDEQKTSIEYQKKLFEDYINNSSTFEIFKFYIDIESGTKGDRIEFNKLKQDVKDKKIEVILSKELSRLARNQRLALDLKELLETNQIHLVTLDGAIDTLRGNTSKFGLYAWMYEEESARTSERIKCMKKTRASNGKFNGSNAPYGYKHKKGMLVVDEEAAKVVKRIFSMYINGAGFDAIARVLYNEGVKTPAQAINRKNATSLWHGSTVRGILENQNYTGDLVQIKTQTISVTNKKRRKYDKENYVIIENVHEAIISKEDFKIVIGLIEERRRKSIENPEINSRAHQNVNLFTNIVFCADCGHGFHYKKNRRGYICGKYNKHGKKACSDHHVLEESLVNIIQNDLKKLSSDINDESYYKKIKTRLRKLRVSNEKELKKYKDKRKEIETLKNGAITKNIKGELSKKDFVNYMKSLDEDLRNILKKLDEIERSISENLDEKLITKIKEVINNALNFKTINREVLNRFVEKIEVTRDKNIKIYYKFSDKGIDLNELIK